MQRRQISEFASRTFDLIVIGGGINGAAIARDASLRGLDVLLLEMSDFSSGTTMASTRLIHGGLRYLEYQEFGLVRESLRERRTLLENAPHLVRPLPLSIPIYERSRRSASLIRAGLTAYDLLSIDDDLPRHRMRSAEQSLKEIPGLNADGLTATATYFDAQAIFPERLTIENLIDASSAGAICCNYVRADRLLQDGFVVTGVEVTDLLTMDRAHLSARTVVNCTGPWVDHVLKDSVSEPSAPDLIGGTAGAHIFVNRFSGGPTNSLYYEASSDGRAIFLIPWNHLFMIGTTDIRFEGDPSDTVASFDEVAYLLHEVNQLFPTSHLKPDDVLFSYSGIRPLPATSNVTEGSITRKHFVVDHSPERAGLYSIVGGKLTTHRSLAEDTVDRIANWSGISSACSTANRPLPGMPTEESLSQLESLANRYAIPPSTCERLLSIYGSMSTQVLERIGDIPELAQPIEGTMNTVGAEIVFAFESELAVNLADALLRRTMIGWSPDLGRAAAPASSAIAGRYLGWSQERVATEIHAYEAALAPYAVPGP